MYMDDRSLTEEQRMMRDTCRAFVDEHVIPFIRQNWQREWVMTPEERLPPGILKVADEIGIRTLGIPEEFGGTPLDPKSQMQTYALIAEEIARGDSGLADKLVQVWKVSTLLRNIAPLHLQEYWFPRIVADPTFLLAHCSTEPRGASDRWLGYDTPETAFQTKAVLNGSEWTLNGRKQFVSNGYDAKLYVVYANTRPGARMGQRSIATTRWALKALNPTSSTSRAPRRAWSTARRRPSPCASIGSSTRASSPACASAPTTRPRFQSR